MSLAVRLVRRLTTRRRLALWGTALAVAGWVVHLHGTWGTSLTDRSGGVRAADYVQFYVSGALVLSGAPEKLYQRAAYLDEVHRRLGSHVDVYPPAPNYGPQVAAAFVPLSALPFPLSLLTFTLLSVAAYASSVHILLRTYPALQRAREVTWIIAIGLPVFAVTLRYGQLSTFFLLACAGAVAALRRQRDVAAGVAFGLLFVKPPLLALGACAALFALRWRFVAGVAGCVAAQVLVAVLTAGPDGVLTYVSVLARLAGEPDAVILFPETAHSLRGFVRLLGTPASLSSLTGWFGFALALAWGVRLWRQRHRSDLALAWTIAATVLTSPHLLTYDLLLLAVPMAAFAAWALENQGTKRWALVTVLSVLIYFAPFSVPLTARYLHLQASTVIVLLFVLATARIAEHQRAKT